MRRFTEYCPGDVTNEQPCRLNIDTAAMTHMYVQILCIGFKHINHCKWKTSYSCIFASI